MEQTESGCNAKYLPSAAANPETRLTMAKKGTTTVWTDEAIAILRRLFHNTPAQDIADIIGCSDNTVLLKAKKLGLKRDPDYCRNNFIGRYTGRGKYRKHERRDEATG
jgi:hypothetical protein